MYVATTSKPTLYSACSLPSAVHGGGDLSRYSNKERKFHSRKMNLHYARKFSMSETLRHHAWAFSHSSTLRLLTQTLPPTNPVVNKLHEFIKMNIVLRVFAPVFLHELLELFVCFANESLNSPFFSWYGGSPFFSWYGGSIESHRGPVQSLHRRAHSQSFPLRDMTSLRWGTRIPEDPLRSQP